MFFTSSKIIHIFIKINISLAEFYIYLANKFKINIKTSINNEGIKLSDGDDHLFITSIYRLDKYSKGIKNRYLYLRDCYLLDLIDFIDGDNVIDVGANIGEIYKLIKKEANVNYTALEPNIDDFKTLNKNVPDGNLINKAAWKRNEYRKFFSVTEPADSSLIPSGKNTVQNVTQIEAIKLDSLKIPGEIKLIKIDCEGTEIETLKGATKILKKTKYVSVDVSDERGTENKSVKNNVINLLKKNSFTVLDEYQSKKRKCVIFKRNEYTGTKKKKGFVIFGQNGWTPKFENICRYMEKHYGNKISFDGLFMSKQNYDEFILNNKLNNFSKKFLKDEIIKEYKIKNIYNNNLDNYENLLGISLWDLIISERRFTDNLFDRKFSIKSLSHDDLKKQMFIILDFFMKNLQNTDFILLTKPSSAWAHALCLIAKKLKIKICIVDQVGQPNHRCTITSTPFQNWTEVNANLNKNNKKYDNSSKKFIFSFRENQKNPPWLIQGKMNFNFSKYLSIYKYKIFLKDLNLFNFFDKTFILFQFFTFRLKSFYLKNFYNAFLDDIGENDKFIYFPLHVEPESSLMIDGTRGIDQFSLIQKISLQLPINWKIYVKEHPNMIGWRKNLFYKKLKKIKNLKLIKFSSNNYKLMKLSQASLVISGTTGWETILLKKPVISIGNSFYQNLPMVYKLENIDKFSSAINWIQKSYKHQEDKLINFISSIMSKSIVIPYDYYWGIGDTEKSWKEIRNLKKYSYRLSNFIVSYLK